VDNLPKTNSDDWSKYSGSYPSDQKTQTPGPQGGSVVENQQPVNSGAFPAPQAAVGQEPTPVVTPPPVDVNNPVVDKKADPFVIHESATQPPPPSSNLLKRIFMFLLLIILLGALGFGAFKLSGKFLTKNQPVTLTYWGLWENEDVLKPAIDAYKKQHPNVEIVYSRQSHKQYRERLQAAIERGEGPDIFRFHNTWIPMLAKDLSPAGSTGYQLQEFQQTFYPVASTDLIVNNKIYGAPLMFDGLALFYNEDLFKAAGVAVPTTWEEFRKTAQTLTVKNKTGQIITAGAALGTTNNVEHFSDILAVMMLQNGADLKNPASREAQDAITFYHLFVEQPDYTWDETQDNSVIAFANGKVAMIFAPSWQVFAIRSTNANLKFQVAPIPQLAGTNINWASYWVEGVSAKSKHSDIAWDFIKFLSQKEILTQLYTEQSKTRPFGEPYSRVDLAQTLINDPYVGAYIKEAQTAKSFFLSSRTHDNGINDRMIKYLEDAINSLSKGVSPESALQTTAKGFSQVLTNFGYPATAP